ncbi:YbfB/YjiJ family MFS transporter [Pseudoroseomonas globiformis]|uniref:YbfB/YjiJ family MFS transporter n=1 Tax=Teichococcus globiformis TaxID=2307229 RepID=A0ABV7G537_9PROT
MSNAAGDRPDSRLAGMALSVRGPRQVMHVAVSAAGSLSAGIGLARFAYVPLFPALVAAGWVDGAGAGLLGACNFTGYLAGALLGRHVGRRLGIPISLDLGMALVVMSFLFCAMPLGLFWLALWRALAGLAGGVMMALAGPAVQAAVPAERRAAAGGIVISGVAVGIVLGAVLVPALLEAGVVAAWLGLAAAAALLWLVIRRAWPAPAAEATQLPRSTPPPPRAGALLAAYGLSGAGMAAPMVYLADLAVRGHGLEGLAVSLLWVLFGLGGVAGTLGGGRWTAQLGGRRAMLIWMLVQVAALGVALLPGAWTVLLAALLSGFSGVGVSAVALTASRMLAGASVGILWVRATAIFAAAQALCGFGLAALFRVTAESHEAVFGTGLGFSILAVLLALAMPRG